VFEGERVVDHERVEVVGGEAGPQRARGVPRGDQLGGDLARGVADLHQPLRVRELLQQYVVDGGPPVLQVTDRGEVVADPGCRVGDRPGAVDDVVQLRGDDLFDDGLDQAGAPAEPVEDGRLAHPGRRGDLLERHGKAPLPERLQRREPDLSGVAPGVGPQRRTCVGHLATPSRVGLRGTS
jgi:hypothetical protein